MKLLLLSLDDWKTLYIDGIKAVENHSLDAGEVLSIITGRDGPIEYEHVNLEVTGDAGWHGDFAPPPGTVDILEHILATKATKDDFCTNQHQRYYTIPGEDY